MLIPEPLPCELSPGYARRLATMNTYQVAMKGIKALHLYLFGESGTDPSRSFTEKLVAISGLPMEDFLRHHTLFPYRHVFTSHPAAIDGQISFSALVGPNPSIRHLQQGAFCCPDCVREDLDFWGFSFFRREHHLPGVWFCGKHRTSLVGSTKADPLEITPNALLKWPQLERTGVDPSIQDHPIVARYTAISEAWLSPRAPISLNRAVIIIKRRARDLGIRDGRSGTGTTLSDVALEQLPQGWLMIVRPELAHPKNNFRCALDGVMNCTGTPLHTKSYALALALLFDSADSALNAILDTSEPVPTKQVRLGKDFCTSSHVVDTYIAHRGKALAIAKDLNLSYKHTRQGILQRSGLPALSLSRQATLQALVDFGKGASLSEAFNRKGANREDAERLLRVASARFTQAIGSILDSNRGPSVAKNAQKENPPVPKVRRKRGASEHESREQPALSPRGISSKSEKAL